MAGEALEQLVREKAACSQHAVESKRRVTLAENADVSGRIVRFFRIDAKKAAVSRDENIDARKGRSDVGRLGPVRAFQNGAPHVARGKLQLAQLA